MCLNRPDKANAMNAPMWEELQRCFEWLDQQPSVRAVILAGNGKHFCAGLDLAVFADLHSTSADPARRAEQLRRTILRLQDNLTAIEKCRVPVLAAIHKTCIGGGVDMTCCADMRYATEDAFFSIREIDIGMTADVGTLQRLPRIIPDGVVRELAYTGRNMDAEEAREVGFVNRVFENRETMMREVTAIARAIAAKAPLAVRGTKGNAALCPRPQRVGWPQLHCHVECRHDEPGGFAGRHTGADDEDTGGLRGLGLTAQGGRLPGSTTHTGD